MEEERNISLILSGISDKIMMKTKKNKMNDIMAEYENQIFHVEVGPTKCSAFIIEVEKNVIPLKVMKKDINFSSGEPNDKEYFYVYFILDKGDYPFFLVTNHKQELIYHIPTGKNALLKCIKVISDVEIVNNILNNTAFFTEIIREGKFNSRNNFHIISYMEYNMEDHINLQLCVSTSFIEIKYRENIKKYLVLHKANGMYIIDMNDELKNIFLISDYFLHNFLHIHFNIFTEILIVACYAYYTRPTIHINILQSVTKLFT